MTALLVTLTVIEVLALVITLAVYLVAIVARCGGPPRTWRR